MRGRNFSVLLTAWAACGCSAMNHAERGTALGGLVGAGLGAAIGDASSGKAGKGALIGGAVGALAGGLAGASEDRHEARVDREVARQHALSLQEVVQMTQQGLSEQVICNQVRTAGCTQRLTASDLSYLKQSGVAESVILEMQRASARPVVVAAPPMIVERPVYYGPPPMFYGPPAVGVGFHYHRRR